MQSREYGWHVDGIAGDAATGQDGQERDRYRPAVRAPRAPTQVDRSDRARARAESAHWLTRTALCVEARPAARQRSQGRGPPWRRQQPPLRLHAAAAALEDYLDLLAALEATAAEQGVRIVLEGYRRRATRA